MPHSVARGAANFITKLIQPEPHYRWFTQNCSICSTGDKARAFTTSIGRKSPARKTSRWRQSQRPLSVLPNEDKQGPGNCFREEGKEFGDEEFNRSRNGGSHPDVSARQTLRRRATGPDRVHRGPQTQ